MRLKNLSKVAVIVFVAVLISIGMISTVFAQCLVTSDNSGIQIQTLYAGQTIEAGTVDVKVVGNNLEVTYITTGGWELTEAHLWVGDDINNMPQTRRGSPKIGNFPYHSEDITGETSYVFTVPLEDLNFSCPSDMKDYYVAAHAALRKSDGYGGYQIESAWADGDRFVPKGMWGTFFMITLTCDCNMNGDENNNNCETAFAFSGGTNEPDDDITTCFRYIDENNDGYSDFNRWGWTNGAVGVGTYKWYIYAAAGQCDISKGTLVGKLTVDYDGEIAIVTFNMFEPYSMQENHLYVGNEILARDVNNEFTVAPGQFPGIHEGLNEATSDFYVFTGLSGNISVVAHAVVCGF